MELRAIRQMRGEATRQAILEAAEQIFANVGFDAARLEDVALAVGIKRPSIIYYFPTKQDLYDAVESDIFEAMHHMADEKMAAASAPLARLLALLDAWLDFQIARPTASRIILRLVADSTPRHGNPTQFSHSAISDMERVIADGIKAGAFRPLPAMHLVNAVASSALFYVCNSSQFGADRLYDPAEPARLAEFRALLHLMAKTAVSPMV